MWGWWLFHNTRRTHNQPHEVTWLMLACSVTEVRRAGFRRLQVVTCSKRSCSFWDAVQSPLNCPIPPGLPKHSLQSEIQRYSGHWKNLWSLEGPVAVRMPGYRNKRRGALPPSLWGCWDTVMAPDTHVTWGRDPRVALCSQTSSRSL